MDFHLSLSLEGTRMLSQLERISQVHAYPYIVDGKAMVFANRVFRISAGQWPYEVSQISLPSQEGEVDTDALAGIVEGQYGPAVMVHRQDMGSSPQTYFLPQAVPDDPLQRVLYVPDNRIKGIRDYMAMLDRDQFL